MKFTHLYEELKFSDVFSAASPEEAEERKAKFTEMKIKEVVDNCQKTKLPDGSWHIHGDLNIGDFNLTTLKDLNVSRIDGSFFCFHNKLNTLEGGPKEVGGDFSCSYNNLTDLKGAPVIVGRDFICSNNRLISLEGAPKKVGGTFGCRFNMAGEFTKEEVQKVSNVKGHIVV